MVENPRYSSRLSGRCFFQGLLEHAAVERQFGDQGLEAADLGFEFTHADLFVRCGILLEGLPSVVGGRIDTGLPARLVDVQSGVEVGPDVPEDRGDPVGAGPLSHAIAPWSLPVVRFCIMTGPDFGGQAMAWNLKAWSALMVPVSPRHAAKHAAEKRRPRSERGCGWSSRRSTRR